MDGNDQSLERLGALWQQLRTLQPNTSEYEALAKQIRAESDAHNGLIEAHERPHRKPQDPSQGPGAKKT